MLGPPVLGLVPGMRVEFGKGNGTMGGSVIVLAAKGMPVVVVVTVKPVREELSERTGAEPLNEVAAVAVMFSVDVLGEFAMLPVRGVAEVFQIDVGNGGKTPVVVGGAEDGSVMLTVGTNENDIVFVLVETKVVVFVTTDVLTFGGRVNVLCRVKLEFRYPEVLGVPVCFGVVLRWWYVVL